MPIKVDAKDTDELIKDIEEDAMNMNMFATNSGDTLTLKINTGEKAKETHRSSYLNKDLSDDEK